MGEGDMTGETDERDKRLEEWAKKMLLAAYAGGVGLSEWECLELGRLLLWLRQQRRHLESLREQDSP